MHHVAKNGLLHDLPTAHAFLAIFLVAVLLEVSSSQELGNINQGLRLLGDSLDEPYSALDDTNSVYDDELVEDQGKRAWNSGFTGGVGKRAWNSGFNGGVGKRAWNSGFVGGVGKRAWNSGFAGGVGKRAWNSGFTGGVGKRAWNSGFSGGVGKRAWNSGFTGGVGKRAWNSGFTGGVGKRDDSTNDNAAEDVESNAINEIKAKRNWNSIGVRGSWGKRASNPMRERYLLVHPYWVSALKNSDMEKKDVGWMAMRGSWGRKKRTSVGSRNETPIHESISFDKDAWSTQGANSINNHPYQQLNEDKFVKKSIPKIDEKDISKFVQYFNKPRTVNSLY